MNNQEDKLLISLSDILALFRRSKWKIIFWMAVFGLLGGLIALAKPIKYQAEATFREKSARGAGVGNSIAQMFVMEGLGNGPESEAISMIKSRSLMGAVVAKLNLQGQIVPKCQQESWLALMHDNWKVEVARFNKSPYPVLEDFSCPLKIQSIQYHGEVPIFLEVRLDEQGHYQVFNSGQQAIGEGTLETPFISDPFSFSLAWVSPWPLNAQDFSLTINPLTNVTDSLMHDLEVEGTRTDKGVLRISYTHPDRHFACQLINAVMAAYQEYLKQNHDRIAAIQIEYLYKKKQETAEDLKCIMQKHAEFLAQDLSSTGFSDSKREMEFLAQSQHQLKEQLFANELEIKRLKNIQPNKYAYYDQVSHKEGNPIVINATLTEIRNLNQERDALELALRHREFRDLSDEFQGIDIKTANDLYKDYCKRLSNEEAALRCTLFFLDRIEDPDFEITSLSSVLADSVSAGMIAKASQLLINLKDQSNQSPREQERLKAELNLQRTFLTLHLQQMAQLMELNKKLLNEKIYSLQNINLKLVYQKISILEKNLKDYVNSRLDNLQQERVIIEQHLGQIHTEMASLPRKWVAEQQIDQQIESNQLIVREIAKIVESKNISHNLEVIQSAPIDLAIVPLHPKSSAFILYSILGIAFGGVIGSCLVLGRSLAKGIPASSSSLKLMDQHVCGQLVSSNKAQSSIAKQNLDVLRRLQAYFSPLEQTKLLLLIEGQSPDYSLDLAQLLAQKDQRILMIDLNLDQPKASSQPGLLQYLQKEVTSLPILKEEYADYLPTGGVTKYAIERFTSQAFKELLDQLKSDYDWVIATTSVVPCSVEAEALASLFPLIAVTVQKETIEDLSFYIKLAKDPLKKMTFVING